MSYFDVANSPLLYVLVAGGILYIIGLSAVFLIKAWRRCRELGISREKLKAVARSSAVFTIVPSVSIVIGLFSLAAVLGVPWPWYRLSVVGSVSYELMAADMVADGMGYGSVGEMAVQADYSVFGAVMFVMSICILAGVGGYATGVVPASSDHLVIRIEGKGGHGAHPQAAVDPINIGAHIHLALQELISRETDPEETVVLTFGKFLGGEAANIIPSSVLLEGTLRTFHEGLRARLLERIQTVCACTAEAFQGKARLSVLSSACALQMDKETVESVACGWKEEGLPMFFREARMSGSEDFSEVAARVPSAFFVVGGGTAEDGCGVSLHHPKIRFREEALMAGAAAYAAGAAKWLERHGGDAV